MAFDRDYFNLVGPSGGSGPRIWTYISTDNAADVDADDYFTGVADEIRSGDLILHVDPATGTVDNPTTCVASWFVIKTAVGKKDGGVVAVTTHDTLIAQS